MGFRVDVRFNPPKIDSTRADEILANEVKKDTDQYVPAKTGSLSGRARVDGGSVVYPGPYARYLYSGKLMVDPKTGSSYARKGSTKTLTGKGLVFSRAMHGQAQSEWFEASKAVNLEKWKRALAKAVTHGK